MIKTDQENIQVLVRIRPLNSREKAEGAVPCMQVDPSNPTTVVIDQKPYNYDYITGAETTQEDIFNIVGKPVALAWLEGYNACIFAYGQTGAGKTFTMQGRGLVEEGMESPNRGLQPRVFDFVFGLINSLKAENPENEYNITCNYLEIYNEQIMDLLGEKSHDSKSAQLSVREDLKKGVYVENLTEEKSDTSTDAINLLIKGASSRHVGATKMNADSSRSHSVFSLNFESKVQANGMIHVKNSKLHFVDLAGSERQKSTQAAGDRLKEASNINKSLTVLGQVINALVESANGKSRHIPYRDSKLTFILKDSLGGNSRTFMIAACSEANTQFQETLSTLKFAQRAKMIKNKASVNEESQGNLQQLKKEIVLLKEQLADAKKAMKDMEENQSKMTRIATPGKYSPSSSDHSAVILYQQKNFQEMTDKLSEVQSLIRDFNDSRSRVEEYFMADKLGVLSVFNDIVEQKKSGQDVDIIKALTTKMEVEEEGAQAVLAELDLRIVEEISQMSSTNQKIREFEDRRNEFIEKLDEIGLWKFSSPEKEMELMDVIAQREKEIFEVQENLQASLKAHSHEIEEAVSLTEFFKSKSDELQAEIEGLQQQIERNHHANEERIHQFREGFENKLAEYDESSSEMKIKNMELADMIDEQKEEIASLEHTRDDLKKRWEEANENYQKTLHWKNQLESEKDAVETHLKTCEKEMAHLEEKVAALHELQVNDKAHIAKLNEEITQKNAAIVDSEMQIEFMNSKHEEACLLLEESLQAEKDRATALEEEVTRYKEDMETACSTLEFLTKQLEEKSQQLTESQEMHKKELEKRELSEAAMTDMLENEESPLNLAISRITQLEADITSIEANITQKMQDISDLNILLDELRDSLKNSQKEINRLETESAFYQETLIEKEKCLEETTQSLNEKSSQLAETAAQLSEAIEKCLALESTLEAANEFSKKLEEEKQQLESDIFQKNAMIEEDQEKLKVASETHEILVAQSEELKKSFEQAKEQANAFESSLLIITAEKQNLLQKETELTELTESQQIAIAAMEECSQKLEQEFNEAKEKYLEQQAASALIESQLDAELKTLKEQQDSLTQVNQEQEFKLQNIQQSLNQAQEDNDMLTHELKEKEELCQQAELSKEELCNAKNQKIEELMAERKAYEEDFNSIQEKYSLEIQNIATLQQQIHTIQVENATVKKQLQDGKEQMEQFLVEKSKFESERQSIQQEMEEKEAVIQKFKEEYEQIGSKFEIFRTLNEQIEEQKNIYQEKYKSKSKDLNAFESKYNNLESTVEKLNEKLIIKQLENNKLHNQLLIIQSNREKNSAIQEDLQRDLKKEREECLSIKSKYKAMILERQVSQMSGSAISDTQESAKKIEEDHEKLKDQFAKYKAMTERKINEISEKLNRGISATAIMKELSCSSEITKKLEEQTEVINQKNAGIIEIADVMKTYLQDCKKGQIEQSQRDDFLLQLANPLDGIASLSEILKTVMSNVEERERKVAQDALLLKEKKAQYEFYRTKCEELEFKYEKKSNKHELQSNSGNGSINKKRKNSFKENESCNILTEVDLNKKIKPSYN